MKIISRADLKDQLSKIEVRKRVCILGIACYRYNESEWVIGGGLQGSGFLSLEAATDDLMIRASHLPNLKVEGEPATRAPRGYAPDRRDGRWDDDEWGD